MARWRDIEGYEGLYSVSDCGQVKSHERIIRNRNGSYLRPEKILKPGKRGKNGHYYYFVILTNGNTTSHASVHRLVANAFLDNPYNLPEINHKDEDRLNNNAENLEWCTRQYNIEYSKAKRVSQYSVDGEKIAEYKSISVAAEITGIGRRSINNNLCGWSNSAGGYIWKYEMEE